MRNSLIFLMVLFLGCASQNPASLNYEIVTVEQQALESIMETPSEFALPRHQDVYAWERAAIFFDTHTPGGTTTVHTPDHMTLSNRNPEKGYIYSVERQNLGDQFSYKVRCMPQTREANRIDGVKYAKNLARFIKDGTLEVSLLP